jgi:DNA polymerase-3 subunit chi
MTRIDFYFNAPDKLGVAARLAQKAYAAKAKLLIFSRDAQMMSLLDRRLWETPATGFLPHCRASDPLAPETAVLLTSDPEALPHHDILLNLDDERPANFSRFERVLEIVSRDDEEDRARARARFKFYKDRGYEIKSNDLSKEA